MRSPPMAESVDTLIIGGGLAGLTAALDLRRAGRRVLVLEAGPALGGKAITCRTAHGDFPGGPTSFNGRHRPFWRLLDRLGLEAEVVRLHPRSGARYIVRDGKLQGLRPHPVSVLTTGALTLSDKWSMARDLLRTQRAQPAGDESLDAFLTRRFGRAAVDHFFAAVMTGIFAGDLKQLSAQACMPALVAAEKEYGSVLRGALRALGTVEPGTRVGLFTFPGGLGTIAERAATVVPHRLGAPVEALRLSEDGVIAQAGGVEYRARTLVVATEAFEAARLLASAAPEAAQVLAGFSYAPVTLVQWVEATPGQSRLPEGFGYLAAPVERLFAMGTLFVGDLLGEAPRRFSTFVGGAMHPERAALSDGELAAGVASDLRALTGGALGPVANVQRWPRAVFQPPVGHAQALEAVRAGLGTLPVALAGSYLGGAAMKDSIASGFDAAARVLQFVDRRAVA